MVYMLYMYVCKYIHKHLYVTYRTYTFYSNMNILILRSVIQLWGTQPCEPMHGLHSVIIYAPFPIFRMVYSCVFVVFSVVHLLHKSLSDKGRIQ